MSRPSVLAIVLQKNPFSATTKNIDNESADICLIDENNFMIDGLGPVGIKPPNGSEFILRHSILERAALLAMSLYYLIEKHNDINGS